MTENKANLIIAKSRGYKMEERVGIEPTNKGFADHRSNQCNRLNSNGLTLDSMLVGPGLGPTFPLSLAETSTDMRQFYILLGTVFSRPQPHGQSRLRHRWHQGVCLTALGAYKDLIHHPDVALN